jgi:hypothetical protein
MHYCKKFRGNEENDLIGCATIFNKAPYATGGAPPIGR